MSETNYRNDGVCIRCDGGGRAENDGEEGERIPCLRCNGSGVEPADACDCGNAMTDFCPECGRNLCPLCAQRGCCGDVPARSGTREANTAYAMFGSNPPAGLKFRR